MEIHELQQDNQRLKYRNDKLKAQNRKLQIQLSERDKRIVDLYKQIDELNGKNEESYYQSQDMTSYPHPDILKSEQSS